MRRTLLPALVDSDRRGYERSEHFVRICRRWVLAPLLSLLFLAAIALVIAMAIEVPHHAIAMSVPVGFCMMLWVALRFSAAPAPVDEVFPAPPVRTPWRLVDPRLSHWGVWRAELGRLPVGVAGFRDDRQVKAYIHKLLDDWSFRSARGGYPVKISRPVSPWLSPFGDGPKGWKVYRVTLEDEVMRRTGWLRLGAGWAEFQLQPDPTERRLLELLDDDPLALKGEPRLADVMREILDEDKAASQPVAEPAPRRDPYLGQHHPMWDRWIDL